MEAQYNLRSPAVKRLMREAKELHDATEEYFAQPLEDNLFEWHFTVRGPPESDFEGGVYHGRVILPPDYPMKPPSIILLTPNGRFEINKKICLSISGHHPESWQPSWSLCTALLAIIGFMPTHGSGAIGSLDYSTEERKQLAKKSQAWSCPSCGPVARLLKEPSESPDDREAADKEDRALAAQITFKDAGERPSTPNEAAASSEPAPPPQEPKPAAETTEANQEEAPEAVRRRMAAQILARRAERLFQQQQVAANREQVPLAAVTENGTATSTAGNDNMRLAYSATMWLLGSAFVGLLIRRLFFL
ncbi:ubiquitin-conjugating enzyme E2 J1 [Ixodes scapularis]|uniref:ubiquitin-conjugating enzyme E2 J1 n=1 Tax=Ixodes scapularis TaxID=6945 RepID=UPI001C38E2DC|nr:ubiquitin-conjugating enzyme E2 J1 [Ixodes scapularis]XP_040061329.2 ubiquitin-conjugating enzyme E2 J1 [Ixodes scapularis]